MTPTRPAVPVTRPPGAPYTSLPPPPLAPGYGHDSLTHWKRHAPASQPVIKTRCSSVKRPGKKNMPEGGGTMRKRRRRREDGSEGKTGEERLPPRHSSANVPPQPPSTGMEVGSKDDSPPSSSSSSQAPLPHLTSQPQLWGTQKLSREPDSWHTTSPGGGRKKGDGLVKGLLISLAWGGNGGRGHTRREAQEGGRK